jgi:hypothetical protein
VSQDDKKTEEETESPEAESKASEPEPEQAKAEASSAAESESESGSESESESGSEEDDEAADDVEAIAKRVDALDEGDETERLAREEEEKLAQRRRKRGKGKATGLEAAASKRLAKIGAKARPAKRAVPAAVEAADPLIERTQRFGDWVKKNKNVVQGVAILAVLGLIAGSVYLYLDHKKSVEASVALAQAVADERGMIGDPDKADDDDVPHENIPIFKTPEARRDAALAKYREVDEHYKGTGAAWLARLGEGAMLLDKRDPDGAIAAFNDVAGSSLAKADGEVRGRALEGLGFAYELKAQMHPDEHDKDIDQALEQYKQLEATDIFGFKQMAMYHQARCYEAKGDKAKAIELLKGLREELMRDPQGHLFDELKSLTDDRLRRLDPTAVPARRPGGVGAGGELSPELLEKLPPELREKLMHQGAGGPE